MKNKYVFKAYSKVYPELFEKEKERILSVLKTVIAIEHIGSTAVPGLGGKGIIDIAIAVKKQEIQVVIEQLQSLVYEFRPKFSTPDRAYLIIYLPDPEEETRRYHVHLTYPEYSEWKEFIEFREHLKTHPEEMQRYEALKKKAVVEANYDGEKYRKYKASIFKKERHS